MQAPSTSYRHHSLDGLRGIAALSVVLFHFLCAFAPSMLPEYSADPWLGSDTPLAILYNGGFAVAVFFVLSGFVIAKSADEHRSCVFYQLIQRYWRLTVPVTISAIYAWTLLSLFPNAVHELKAVTGQKWLLYVYDGNLPNLLDTVIDGLFRVYKNGWSLYNNVLWTMKIELIGSCLVYIIYSLQKFRLPILLLLVFCLFVCLALAEFEYACFAMGALMHELHKRQQLPQHLSCAALCFGVFFGSMMEGYDHRVLGYVFPIESLRLGQPHKFWHMISATAILYAVLTSPYLSNILARKVPQFLGRISFGLYLVHVPLIYTLYATIFCAFPNHSMLFWIGFLLSFLITASGAGYIFTLLADQPTIQLGRFVRKRIELWIS